MYRLRHPSVLAGVARRAGALTSEPIASGLERVGQLELELLRPATRADRQAIERLLGDDFVEIGSSGERLDRETVITGLLTESSEDRSPAQQIGDLGIAAITDNVALMTYRVCRVDSDGTMTQRWRSSIWRFRDGEWRMVFHQGTPIPPPGIVPTSA